MGLFTNINELITIEGIEKRLEAMGCQPKNGQALCPAHEEHDPSLSYFKGERYSVVVFCHRGCSHKDVYKLLRLGRRAYPEGWQVINQGGSGKGKNGRLVATYEYKDASGKPLYRKKKYIFSPKGKSFIFEYWDGHNWLTGKNNIPTVPYNLDNLVQTKETVFLCEGEKAADALIRAGLCGTSTGGADSWKSDCAKWFEGKRVIILPDNDEPGDNYAEEVFKDLVSISCVQIINLPFLPNKGDAFDWFEAGYVAEDLWAIVEGKTVVERQSITVEPVSEPTDKPVVEEVTNPWLAFRR